MSMVLSAQQEAMSSPSWLKLTERHGWSLDPNARKQMSSSASNTLTRESALPAAK
jgi:hypothetical protein